MSGSIIFAQEFSLELQDTVKQGVIEDEIIFESLITNLLDEEITIKIIRQSNNIPTGWSSSLCFDLCAAPFVDTLTSVVASKQSQEFSFHFFTDGIPGSGMALLTFKTVGGIYKENHLFSASTLVSSIGDQGPETVKQFELFNNYPNPFNNHTIIKASVPAAAQVTLRIYDVLGRVVYTDEEIKSSAGIARFLWSGSDSKDNILPSGVYFYRVVGQSVNRQIVSDLKRLVLLK
jgi:hypothetical protein